MDRPPEILPLSASPPSTIEVVFEVVRAGQTRELVGLFTRGTVLRDALRSSGLAAEGSAVFVGDRPIPLTTVLDGPGRFTVIPTFSGG